MTTAYDIPACDAFDLEATVKQIARLRSEVAKVVVGQELVVEQMLTALIARGHCLLIGVPGLAKTVMAKVLSDALDMQFSRVQFTPDLMPSDITGANILEEDPVTGRKIFRFIPGPIFTNILLADEINRTPPKTQAALLEAMQERTVTFGGELRQVSDPFFVIATQNPLEQEGTYPLPEAQLDRFMFAVPVDYPTHAEENRIVVATTQSRSSTISKVLSAEQVRAMQNLVRQIPSPPHIVRYAVALARATRPTDKTSPDFVRAYVDTGAGPRAGQYLVLAAKSRAVMSGRLQPQVEDVRAAAVSVLRHRIFTNFTALSENISNDDLVKRLLETLSEARDEAPIICQTPKLDPVSESVLTDDTPDIEVVHHMKVLTERIRNEVHKTIIGQDEVVELVLTALLAGGHCLLVGVPGLAKTTLVKTIAEVLDLQFGRVQFTPDLMPSDITGTDVMEVDEQTGRRDFRFIKGPIFTNLLLADEINRTPPKTQAALLEAMQELSVTVGGTTYTLDPPFFTLATQNPLEQEGTYPLPEAQLDRFMFNIFLDYPDEHEEPIIVDRTTGASSGQVCKVIDARQIVRLQQVVRKVPISQHVLTYVTTLVRASRPQTRGCPPDIVRYVHCGAGPRASQYLVMGAKARAVMDGRINVSIADVKAVVTAVLRHRIFTNFSADAEGKSAMDLVAMLLEAVSEPKIKQEKQLMEAEDVIVVRCTHCRKQLKAKRNTAGKHAKCPKCGHVFAVETNA